MSAPSAEAFRRIEAASYQLHSWAREQLIGQQQQAAQGPPSEEAVTEQLRAIGALSSALAEIAPASAQRSAANTMAALATASQQPQVPQLQFQQPSSSSFAAAVIAAAAAAAAATANAAPATTTLAPPRRKRRHTVEAHTERCHKCGATESVEWRRGPDGRKSLCNACGLRYSKMLRKEQRLRPSEPHSVPIEQLLNQ